MYPVLCVRKVFLSFSFLAVLVSKLAANQCGPWFLRAAQSAAETGPRAALALYEPTERLRFAQSGRGPEGAGGEGVVYERERGTMMEIKYIE